MLTYEEFLRQNGATTEEVKALTEGSFSGAAKKMFERLQAEEARAVAAERKATDVESTWKNFYENDVADSFKKAELAAVAAQAEAARYKTTLLEAHKRGIMKLTKDMGFDVDDAGNPNPSPSPSPAAATGSFDPDKYTREVLLPLADKEGDAIAMMTEIASEHAALFPGERPNWRELRREAVQRKVPLEQLWREKFKIDEKRAAVQKAADDARIAAAVDERYKVREQELISKYGNPDSRPLVPSTATLTSRVMRQGEGKQPWDRGISDEAMRNERVKAATEKQLQRQAS